MYDKNNYVVHIRSLKQALNHGLILRKVYRVIQFNQEAWLKEYIDMNTEVRKQAKNDFEKDFFKLMNNSVFGKTMENARKHIDIKLVTTDKRRNQLVSERNYHATKWFSEKLLAIEMKKIKVKMNNPVYLGLSILEISKTLMYEFWYDYVKPKYQSNAKLCYMDADSFIINIKTEDFHVDIANDVEKRFDTSNYEINRPLPKEKNKKIIRLMKVELGGKIKTEFAAIRAKTYSYLMDDGNSDKKARGTKKCVIKRRLKFNDYKDCLLNNKIILKSQQRFKSEAHNTEEVNKIALSSNDDKRLQTFDRITSYPYGASAGKVCKTEMVSKVNMKGLILIITLITIIQSEHNPKWPYIPDHPYRVLIVGSSGSGKTNALLNLIKDLSDIDKIYQYVKNPYEAKKQD